MTQISNQVRNKVNESTSKFMFSNIISKLWNSFLELELNEYFILIWQNQIKIRFSHVLLYNTAREVKITRPMIKKRISVYSKKISHLIKTNIGIH